MQFLNDHWAVIATVLFGVSELLSFIPGVAANGIFQLLFGWLKSQKQ